jgi:hypothetical protein
MLRDRIVAAELSVDDAWLNPGHVLSELGDADGGVDRSRSSRDPIWSSAATMAAADPSPTRVV